MNAHNESTGFFFRPHWYEYIMMLRPRQRAAVTEAVMRFAFTGEMPDEEKTLALSFFIIREIKAEGREDDMTESDLLEEAASEDIRPQDVEPEAAEPENEPFAGVDSEDIQPEYDEPQAIEAEVVESEAAEGEDDEDDGSSVSPDPYMQPEYINSEAAREGKPARIDGVVVPTLDMVKSYFEFHDYEADPTAFYRYHASRGWKINGAVVRNWMKAADAWVMERRKAPGKAGGGARAGETARGMGGDARPRASMNPDGREVAGWLGGEARPRASRVSKFLRATARSS